MAISPTMRAFLQAWWDSKDTPRGLHYYADDPRYIASARTGLCACLVFFCEIRSLPVMDLSCEITDLFIADNLSVNYPFDDSRSFYEIESENREMHLNPARRKWVQKHLGLSQ